MRGRRGEWYIQLWLETALDENTTIDLHFTVI
jgi:hypothetical protein